MSARLSIALALLAAPLSRPLHAAETILAVDKIGPPARCLQRFLGLHDPTWLEPLRARPVPVALGDVDGRKSADDPATAWALRAQGLKPCLSPSDWRRLQSAWDRYVSARIDADMALNRACTGDDIETSFGADVLFVVAAPFEILGAFAPDEKGEATPSLAMLPVAGAIGLAADAVFTAALPAVKLTAGFHVRRTAREFKRFTDLVAGFEGAKPSSTGR